MESTRQKLGRTAAGHGNLLARLGVRNKKVLFAAVLVILMAVMWLRLFKGPKAAEAQSDARAAVPENGKIEIEITFVELPKVPGRNDVISRDFFSLDGSLGNRTEVAVVTGDGGNSIVRIVTKKVRLEAIDLSDEPKAFINDRLYAAGDRMLIKDGSDEYECQIIAIEENTVLIRCRETEIKLKLTQDNEAIE